MPIVCCISLSRFDIQSWLHNSRRCKLCITATVFHNFFWPRPKSKKRAKSERRISCSGRKWGMHGHGGMFPNERVSIDARWFTWNAVHQANITNFTLQKSGDSCHPASSLRVRQPTGSHFSDTHCLLPHWQSLLTAHWARPQSQFTLNC